MGKRSYGQKGVMAPGPISTGNEHAVGDADMETHAVHMCIDTRVEMRVDVCIGMCVETCA